MAQDGDRRSWRFFRGIFAGLLLLTPAGVSAGGEMHVVRSLVEEVSRAEVRERGLFIDLGTPDQHKYIRGGWRTGWGRTQAEQGLAASAAKTARLSWWDWKGGAVSLVMRASSNLRGQRVRVQLDGKSLGSREIGKDWRVIELPFGNPLEPGRHAVWLHFQRGGTKEPAARVDWIWLRTAAGPPPRPAKRTTPGFVAARPALRGDPPRTYSYYLEIPPAARLAFSLAAEKNPRFHVDVTLDGEPTRRLLSTRAEENRWSQARVGLSEFSGRVVRLDLVTSGPGGRAAWGEPRIEAPGPASRVPEVKPEDRARNLIYVVIDTARQDVFSPFNPDSRVRTPAFDGLAAEATIFPNAYVNAPWTKPSVATYLGGLYPATHGAKRKRTVLSPRVLLLQEHLQKSGFRTAGFIANGYFSKKFGFGRGWSTYRNYIRERRRTDARHVYNDALKWLRSAGQRPFFLFIQTIDPHVPYQTPASYQKPYCDPGYRGRFKRFFDGYDSENFARGKLRLTPKEKKHVICLYQAEVSYHDEHFGRFLSGLRRLGLLENSLVVISSDHGEELFEHGGLGHGHHLWEEVMKTPLAIRYPPLYPPGRRVEAVVGLVDFVPTALEALGVEAMPDLEGVSLRRAVHGRPVPAPGYAILERLDLQRAVRVGRLKLIETHRGKTLLFDLAEDPGERNNLAHSHPLARRACEIYLGEGLAVRAKTRRLSSMGRQRDLTGPEADIGDELREQLNSLGYTDQP